MSNQIVNLENDVLGAIFRLLPMKGVVNLSLVCTVFKEIVRGEVMDVYWRDWFARIIPREEIVSTTLVFPTIGFNIKMWGEPIKEGLQACWDNKKTNSEIMKDRKYSYSFSFNRRKTIVRAFDIAINFYKLDLASESDMECWISDMHPVDHLHAYLRIATQVLEKEGTIAYALDIPEKGKEFPFHRTQYADELIHSWVKKGYLFEALQLLEAWYLKEGVFLDESRPGSTYNATTVLNRIINFVTAIEEGAKDNSELLKKINCFQEQFMKLYPEHFLVKK